ncbi:MAG: hypothetical protein WC879_02055 [Melioribacteraceae bacterium]
MKNYLTKLFFLLTFIFFLSRTNLRAQQKTFEEHVLNAEISVKVDSQNEPFAAGLTDSLGQFMVKMISAEENAGSGKQEITEKKFLISVNLPKEFFTNRKSRSDYKGTIAGVYYFSLEISSNNENYTIYFSADIKSEQELADKPLEVFGPFIQTLTGNIHKVLLEVTLQSVSYNRKGV